MASCPDDCPPRPQPACDAALVRAFELLGKRWNGIILATLQPGPLGFAALQRNVIGISASVLSGRLTELSRAHLVERQLDAGSPVTIHYRLRPAGLALQPTFVKLTEWAVETLPAI
jgi:DNA-binding HxlR family transcriptional regulator